MSEDKQRLSTLDRDSFIRLAREVDSLRVDFHLFANHAIAKLGLRQQDVATKMELSASIFNAKLSGISGWSIAQIIRFIEGEDCWDEFTDWCGERQRYYGGIPIPRDRR